VQLIARIQNYLRVPRNSSPDPKVRPTPGELEKLISPSGASWASSPGALKSFVGNRSRDTAPELEIRRRLHALGFRYRVNVRPDPTYRGTADIVFRKARIAVSIDGCYWHLCPEHYKAPKTHAEYWLAKVKRNVERDRALDARLTSNGWLSLRYWEHESPGEVAERIIRVLGAKPIGGLINRLG
jgi:DNA mismatch endonuclease (patch repair protein)